MRYALYPIREIFTESLLPCSLLSERITHVYLEEGEVGVVEQALEHLEQGGQLVWVLFALQVLDHLMDWLMD